MPYAEVVVELTNRKLDRIFHYTIPGTLKQKVQLGSRVVVPFGNRTVGGVVIGFAEKAEVEVTKEIKAVQENVPPLTSELLKLARWMAEYYICPLSVVLQAILPPISQRTGSKIDQAVRLKPGLRAEEVLQQLKRAPKQAAVIKILADKPVLPVKPLLKKAAASMSNLKALQDKGYIELITLEQQKEQKLQQPYELTPEQGRVLVRIKEALRKGQFAAQLLFGVTGSGKTEVYLQALAINRQLGRQAIVLLPEIALTEQMVGRYRARFGEEVVAWHSDLTPKERRLAWEKISGGHVSIIVGARSAIFAPFSDLGLIILDEEHENSYRQETNPKYHAREVALKRGELNGALVLLGSATPSIESAYRASTGQFELLTLTERFESRPLPQVHVVDLREELRQGNFSIFSRTLQQKIQERLNKREQTILFLNRRGFSSFFVCRDCGHTIGCKSCAISLTYHAAARELKCHYCGYRQEVPQACPECGSRRIRGFGIGTERVEQEVRLLFPEAKVGRLDTDISNKKGYRQEILQAFKQSDLDILVGTQMIAKGLDFPGVTLVGVISADLSLNLPDFRAGERTFQLLTQVAGRAGRGSKPGEVVIQTYWPDHEVVLAAQKHDYQEFYQKEILVRKELCYPPFVHLIRVLISGKDEEKVIQGCQDFAQLVKTKNAPEVVVLGPAPAPIQKLQDLYRWQIILKGDRLEEMRRNLGNCLQQYHQATHLAGRLHWSIDVDPLGMF